MVLNIVFFALSVSISLSFIILLMTSGGYNDYITPLDKKDFMLREIYGVGFKLLSIFKVEFKSREAIKLRKNVTVLYGEVYADYYMRVLYAQRISIIYFALVIMMGLSAMAEGTDKILLFAVGIVTCVTLYYYFTTLPASKVKNRSTKLLDEFPDAVSTIALLVSSGMLLRDAWKEVSLGNDSDLYMEMRKVNDDMDNGIAEIDALYRFANRCETTVIKKFTSFVIQGLEKGNKDLSDTLKNQTKELWEQKKQNTLKRGELASSKLMIPLMIMFIGILIMIIGPIMSNLSF